MVYIGFYSKNIEIWHLIFTILIINSSIFNVINLALSYFDDTSKKLGFGLTALIFPFLCVFVKCKVSFSIHAVQLTAADETLTLSESPDAQ